MLPLNASCPLIGLPADTFEDRGQTFHSIGEKYLHTVASVSQGIPVVIPALAHLLDLHGLLDRLDGVVITGAVSNVHPPHYGEVATERHEPYDFHRDALTFALIAAVLARRIPLLCICRGFQELNVVLGGALDTELHEIPGKIDHRGPRVQDLDLVYAPSHKVLLTADGQLSTLLETQEMMVNSIHRQGISRLAERLSVEAVAEDGTIEAVSVKDFSGFAFGFQWHPEYKALQNPHYRKIFEAFGAAARSYAAEKKRGAVEA